MTRKRFSQRVIVLIVPVLIAAVIAVQMRAGDEANKSQRIKDQIQLGPVDAPRPKSSPQMPPSVPKSPQRPQPGVNSKLGPV